MADVTVWPRHYAGTNDSHGWIGLRFNRNQAIYVRMNRWAKKGVLDRVFAKLQQEQILRITIEAFGLDSTSAKVHPDGTGALSVGSTATAPTNLNPLLAVVWSPRNCGVTLAIALAYCREAVRESGLSGLGVI
jgi:hypothetical protein